MTGVVLQGFVIGPLLFHVYVNHVVSFLNSGFRVFTDDSKLYLSFNGPHDHARSPLLEDIDLLSSTNSLWGLRTNAIKCSVMRFAL